MPAYDYKCSQCDIVKEVVHSIMDEPKLLCELCEAPLQKIISRSVGVAFKGSGFYITDSKSSDSSAKQTA